MSQIDLFDDIVYGVARGISEDEFKEKVRLIKRRYPRLSYDRIYKIIDHTIDTKCWSYDCWDEWNERYVLPFNDMIGKKHWELSVYISATNTRSREDQLLTIKLIAES